MQTLRADPKRLAQILVLVSTVLVAACGTTKPATISANSLAQIKTVGVVSLIGDTFNYEQIGITDLSNDAFNRPAAEFGIDPYVTSLVTQQLAGRFTLRPVTYNPGDFPLPLSPDTIGTTIQAKVAPNNLDAYIVVAKSSSGIKRVSTMPILVATTGNEDTVGLGLARRAMAFYHLYWAHALYWVGIVDGHTGKLLASNAAKGGQQELGLFEVPAVSGPYKDVDETYWPANKQNVSSAEAKLLADKMKELIAASLPDTLNRTLATQ
jgi:hypothetical protein